jgi:hypothetical protein
MTDQDARRRQLAEMSDEELLRALAESLRETAEALLEMAGTPRPAAEVITDGITPI